MRSDAARKPEPALLRISDICVRFGGVVALDRVSFDVDEGTVCGLIGPNGAGKSTLFNCLSRIYAWESGAIVFEGVRLNELARHRIAGLGIGRTFQNLSLFKSMSVYENVLVGTHHRCHAGIANSVFALPRLHRAQRQAHEITDGLLGLLDLHRDAERPVAELPFATQKRVELARALAGKPRLLLLDEPACGLNYEEVDQLAELIAMIKTKLRVTVLLVEHHMRLVMGISDQVVALNFGRKIASGSPQEVRQHPGVIEAYLGAEV